MSGCNRKIKCQKIISTSGNGDGEYKTLLSILFLKYTEVYKVIQTS